MQREDGKLYHHICLAHWTGSQVCRSRKSRCHLPRSGLRLHRYTLSGYCGSRSARCLHAHKWEACIHTESHTKDTLSIGQQTATQHTFLVAVDFIRTIVLAVIEVVAAKDRADASTTGALELILLAYRFGRRHWWRSTVPHKSYLCALSRVTSQLKFQ